MRPDLTFRRRAIDVDRATGSMVETEPDGSGLLRRVLILFLANRECPWRCLMCDLWQYTTLEMVPPGAIPIQIRTAIVTAPVADWIKLYNAGSFFDTGAIPLGDHGEIANLVKPYRRVIVECHPLLVGARVEAFARLLDGARLEVAMGLESAHPEVLDKLNKGMTVADFVRATRFLVATGVDVRAFVLVRPPYLDDLEALEWAVRSARTAFEAGAGVVSLIPTRMGNGALEALALQGDFAEPSLELIEEVVDQVMALGLGRVFVDLWDLERFGGSRPGFDRRKARLQAMNWSQTILPRISGPA